MKKYRCIMADPPWMVRGGRNGKRGWSKSASPDAHYQLMPTAEILKLPVGDLAEDDAHLWLWVPSGFLPHGLEAMEAWGFRYVTNVAWIKEGTIGLGQYVRTMHELCLFGVRGRLPYARRPDGRRDQPSSVHCAPRGRHSEKPEGVRNLIARVSPAPRIELFARERFEGWDAWGDQVQSDIEFPPREAA